jgi:exonuclease III
MRSNPDSIATPRFISNKYTQNVQGLKRGKYDANNKRISGEYDYTKLEYTIELMKEKNIDCYFMQETWWEDTEFDVEINGYHMFRHNDILENNLRKGVAIILSPRYYEGWIAAGKPEPKVGKSVGRILSLTIKLECINEHGQVVRGRNGIKYKSFSLVSAYHPWKEANDEFAMFVHELDGHLESITCNNSNEIIMGADINADVGCHDDNLIEDYGKVMGPNGLHKHNSKGELLLGMYLAQRL